MNKRGFTYLDGLIILSIVSILAAITVPNYMEARIHSQVTQTKSDMRNVAAAMEGYYVDNNLYLPTRNIVGVTRFDRLRPLTTPTAYIKELPKDIFTQNIYTLDQQYYPYWGTEFFFAVQAGNTQSRFTTVPVLYNRILKKGNLWLIFSTGPDQDYEPAQAPWTGFEIYDPTNGTFSNGDILRWGP